jgi:hypothetical protein
MLTVIARFIGVLLRAIDMSSLPELVTLAPIIGPDWLVLAPVASEAPLKVRWTTPNEPEHGLVVVQAIGPLLLVPTDPAVCFQSS